MAEATSRSKGTVVLILDACHSGLGGSQSLASNDSVVDTLLTATGAPMIVLAGSKGRQSSLERSGGGGGLFTSAIVEAISSRRKATDVDGNGVIDLGELYASVKARVVGEAHQMVLKQEADVEQTPWLARNSLIGEMPMF